MVRLLSELLEAELVSVPLDRRGKGLARAGDGLGPRRRRGRDMCLVVAPAPAHLDTLMHGDYWRRGYRHVAGGLGDRQLLDRPDPVRRPAPRPLRPNLSSPTRRSSENGRPRPDFPSVGFPGGPTSCGSAERGGATARSTSSASAASPRAGRTTTRPAARLRLRACGSGGGHRCTTMRRRTRGRSWAPCRRPSSSSAFSNAVSPAPYTHPSREYLTGRWTDSLASGATTAGITPRWRSDR